MTNARPIGLLAAGVAAVALILPAASAQQRPQPDPLQRIDRLERQIDQMQRQVFPKGRPADTAGFASDPAATQSSVSNLAQRLDSLERQMADLLRQVEENGHRQRTIEGELSKLRSDQEQRFNGIEQRLVAPPLVADPVATALPPGTGAIGRPAPSGPGPAATGTADADAGESAYTEGFRLWEQGQYDGAITSLRAFVAAYPKHRRVSFANNLIGRALLDKGQPKAAVPAFLANYRNNPGGERAPDSLYYMGVALMKLGQNKQACNAFAELDEVYGAKVRPDLKALENEAKQQAGCE